jgi:uncharacterized protein YqeY
MSEVNFMEKIKTDLHAAMKASDRLKSETLRMLKSEIQKEEIVKQRALNNEEILAVLKRSIKQRQDSTTQFEQAGRPELAQKEKAEIDILKVYLPSQLTGDALKAVVDEVIQTLKATSKKDTGLVMKTVMAKYGAQVDGKEVQTLVGEKLK